jgi:hypothetical protein
MKAVVFGGIDDIGVESVPDPSVRRPPTPWRVSPRAPAVIAARPGGDIVATPEPRRPRGPHVTDQLRLQALAPEQAP